MKDLKKKNEKRFLLLIGSISGSICELQFILLDYITYYVSTLIISEIVSY